MTGKLEMWTVYDHPADFPDGYVARKFVVDGPEPKPTDVAMWSVDLEEVRDFLENLGLTCLARSEGDEPQIVESWV